ncbi:MULTISPECIES: energy transducer TonB [Pseudomonas fluorescens group]|uniref:Protein TonB n=1 Tax=Pseudomonas fluorescens TaxID=294 RepID=A0A0D0REE1_PSEFL|nr:MULTISPECIES: energy transducer TonB [Pseudomonas fluorescens group]AZE60771.1 Ferric siderophore transport system, periplasmic binding protein TonB [Pseudomonas synxantha]KIR17757.1 transport protein TonB [Pseudomonas fluorescens]
MTAMIMHNPTPAMAPRDASGVWRNSLAAGLAVALHVGVLAALMMAWSTQTPVVDAPRVMHTQLVMLPAAPAPEPLAATSAPPEPEPEPVPAKPRVDPQVQVQKLEKAALARKRVEEKKAEQQQERLATEQRNRELEQQRLDQQRLAVEKARAAIPAPAFDSRQYQPLSKAAPDYPERALDKHIEGDCTLEYSVNIQGRVENPKVLDGCHPLFIRPSLAAANTFRYQPRIVDGKAVAVPAVRNTFHYRIK